MNKGSRLDWIAFAVVLLASLIFHIQFIHLPHFWDEAWVYAPAIKAMSETIPSLMPSSIPLDLGRGHPLLFHFLGGCWVKLFGVSNASLHLFALSVSFILVFVVYCFLKQVIDWKIALFSVVLLLAQPIFLVQMGMVYPELLMTLGILIALFSYAKEKDFHFSLGLSIAILSKEPALVFFVAFLFWDLFRLLMSNNTRRWYLKYLLPISLIILHPISLYWEFGWFLYPEHVGFIELDIQTIKYNLRKVFRVLFEKQNREWFIYPMLIVAVLVKRFRHWGFNLLLLAIGFSAYKVLVWKWVVPNYLFILIMILASIAPLVMWLFASSQKPKFNQQETIVALGYISIVGYLIFSAMNFFTPRYLLVVLAITIVLISMIANNVPFPSYLGNVLLVVSIIVSSIYLIQNRTPGESNLGLYDELQVQQKMANWVSENVSKEKSVATNFVTATYLRNPKAGYLSSMINLDLPIIDLCDTSQKADILIFTSTGDSGNECRKLQNENSSYRMIYSDTIRKSSAVILEKRR